MRRTQRAHRNAAIHRAKGNRNVRIATAAVRFGVTALVSLAVVGCSSTKSKEAKRGPSTDDHFVAGKTGQHVQRNGDEIVIAGQMFHTGTRVVLWMDPGGFDAYRTDRRFAPYKDAGYLATTRAAAETMEKTGKPAQF